MLLKKKKAKPIILDTLEEAKRLLASSEVREVTFYSLCNLSQYYASLNMKPAMIKKELIKYCDRYGSYDEEFREEIVNSAIKKSKLYSVKDSNFKIAITENEVESISKLPHRWYKVFVYMLFVSKLLKFQDFKISGGKKRSKDFRTFFTYDIESAFYATGKSVSSQELLDFGREIYRLKLAAPIAGLYSWQILCADYNNKKVGFIIDGKKDFLSQIKYYCYDCGNQMIKKARYHSSCQNCYKEKVREKDRIRKS